AAPCACPSASRSRGSGAQRRGCRRSRRCPRAMALARRSRRRRLEVGALDLARLVDLEHVAFLHVVEAVEQDAALEALLDLAHVVLEALELGDLRLVDDGAVADDADAGVALDRAVGDVRAGDRAEPRDA